MFNETWKFCFENFHPIRTRDHGIDLSPLSKISSGKSTIHHRYSLLEISFQISMFKPKTSKVSHTNYSYWIRTDRFRVAIPKCMSSVLISMVISHLILLHSLQIFSINLFNVLNSFNPVRSTLLNIIYIIFITFNDDLIKNYIK